MAITYEWDLETVDLESDDIIDHDFRETLSDLDLPASNQRLVLVRNVGNDLEGLTDRLWAYVCKGQLPICFHSAGEVETSIRVPSRFHRELHLRLR